jgi:putative endonuclease
MNRLHLDKRAAAEARGRGGESLAAWALRLKGYRILSRRLKTPLGEIDMVAQRVFGPVCFIEVKARPAEGAALLSVSPAQRTRIMRAANLYLAGRPDLARRGARFDIIAVASGRWPRHHADAWRPDDLGI